jgi:hypothetical protein
MIAFLRHSFIVKMEELLNTNIFIIPFETRFGPDRPSSGDM